MMAVGSSITEAKLDSLQSIAREVLLPRRYSWRYMVKVSSMSDADPLDYVHCALYAENVHRNIYSRILLLS